MLSKQLGPPLKISRRKPVNPLTDNYLLSAMWFITAAYADPHKTTFVNGFKARLPDYERSQSRG